MSKTSYNGKVWEWGLYGTDQYGQFLYDYDIGGADPKPFHYEMLDAKIIPLLNDPSVFYLYIFGYASRIWASAGGNGDLAEQYNHDLAQRRAQNVWDYINSALPENNGLIVELNIYDQHQSPFPDDERERAVFVTIASYAPPPLDIPSPWNTKFDIKLLGGLSVSAPIPATFVGNLGWDHFIFEITDRKDKSCCYVFWDANIGIGLPWDIKNFGDNYMKYIRTLLVANGSWSPGNPSPFETQIPMPVDAFSGEASIFQIPGLTLGSLSIWNEIFLNLQPSVLQTIELFDYRKINPDVIEMTSGNGFSINLQFDIGLPNKFDKIG